MMFLMGTISSSLSSLVLEITVPAAGEAAGSSALACEGVAKPSP